MTALYLNNAAEIWTNEGPTGRYAEVIRGEIQDAGGNVLCSGAAEHCVLRLPAFGRVHTVLVPTEWREVDGEVVGSETTWQMVMIPSGSR